VEKDYVCIVVLYGSEKWIIGYAERRLEGKLGDIGE
jgi:hypothetical protein